LSRPWNQDSNIITTRKAIQQTKDAINGMLIDAIMGPNEPDGMWKRKKTPSSRVVRSIRRACRRSSRSRPGTTCASTRPTADGKSIYSKASSISLFTPDHVLVLELKKADAGSSSATSLSSWLSVMSASHTGSVTKHKFVSPRRN
jgi:hypothetical protein